MATAIDPQEIVTDAHCLSCQIPKGYVWYSILAVLLDLANGDPVPTDAQEIVDEARCLSNCIPAGYLPYAILAALQNISTSGGGTQQVYEDRDPAPPNNPALPAISYDSSTGVVTQWNGSAWV